MDGNKRIAKLNKLQRPSEEIEAVIGKPFKLRIGSFSERIAQTFFELGCAIIAGVVESGQWTRKCYMLSASYQPTPHVLSTSRINHTAVQFKTVSHTKVNHVFIIISSLRVY